MPSNLLSDDERSYFMDMESLFNHPGWTRLAREIKAEADRVPGATFDTAKSWDAVLEARSWRRALETLLSYPDSIEQRRQNLEREKQLMIEEVNAL